MTAIWAIEVMFGVPMPDRGHQDPRVAKAAICVRIWSASTLALRISASRAARTLDNLCARAVVNDEIRYLPARDRLPPPPRSVEADNRHRH